MTKLIYTLLFSVLLSSVAGANENKTYHRACHIDEGDVLTTDIVKSDSQWTITHTAFEDDACEQPYLAFEVAYTPKYQDENLDLVVTESAYTPITQEVAMVLNMISYCGYTDWAPKEKKTVSGYLCDEFKAPNKGDTLYTISRTEKSGDDELLFIGLPTEGRQGNKADNRHKSWDKRAFKLVK